MNLKKKRHHILRIGKSTDIDQDDGEFYRCSVCGFVCNSELVTVDKTIHTEYSDGNTYSTDGDGDSIVSTDSGCPLCGTLFSRK